MKYILLGENKKFIQNEPEELHKINLSKDIVICCPDFENINNINVKFDIDEFLLHNISDVVFNKDTFIYHPKIKISLPYGIKLNDNTPIPGLSINTRTTKKYIGKDLNVPNINYENVEIDLSSNSEYVCYYYFTYIFKEYSRNTLLSHLKDIKSNGLRIPKFTNIINFHFTQSIIGSNDLNFNGEVYVIYSSYIYDNFPDFGTFKD